MRLGVVGGGLQGRAALHDFLAQPDVRQVQVFDSEPERLEEVRHRFPDERLVTHRLDASNREELTESLRGLDAVLSAVPYFLNLAVTRAAISARSHLVDLGGNTDVVFKQRSLDAEARAAGIAVLPDQGLAPGLAGILAAYGFRDFDSVESVRLRVGGLPQRPRGPLGYALVFSIHGLLNEYSGEAVGLEEGELSRRPTLTGREEIHFPHPVGRCEAAYTSGGTSTLPWTLRGRVQNLDYKTVRYPGHWERLRFLKEIGFLETAPIAVGRVRVPPRDCLAAVLGPVLDDPTVRDLVVLRVRVRGTRAGESVLRQFEMMDFYDASTSLTAMTRTTAFPATEALLMLARGQVSERGVLAAEQVLARREYVDALRARGLRIREIESVQHHA